MYEQYSADPDSVDASWAEFFKSHGAPGVTEPPARAERGQRADPGRPDCHPLPAALRSSLSPASNRPAPEATHSTEQPAHGQESRGRFRCPTPSCRPASNGDVKQPSATHGGAAHSGQGRPPHLARRARRRPRRSAESGQPADVALEEPVRSVLRGAPARTAKNMDISLSVPTATSVRSLPVKLLIDQRVVINNHLRRARGGKVSYTHIIGYAMVRALETVPEMNNGYEMVDGKPTMVVPAHVNLGLAIDMPKPDGTRQLLVPSIKSCERLDFAQFWTAYEEMVKKARAGSLTLEDFAGTTITLTNPGTIGTNHSVPAADAGPGRDHRRRLDGVPAGVPGLRSGPAQRDERLQGHDADLHVRPPGHPGRPVRACIWPVCMPCCWARTASTTTSSGR